MIDVVSPPRSLGTAPKLPVFVLRISGAPQLEQYLARSGFGRLHSAQYLLNMGSPGPPPRAIAGRHSIASGDAPNGTCSKGSGSSRNANRPGRPPLGVRSGP